MHLMSFLLNSQKAQETNKEPMHLRDTPARNAQFTHNDKRLPHIVRPTAFTVIWFNICILVPHYVIRRLD